MDIVAEMATARHARPDAPPPVRVRRAVAADGDGARGIAPVGEEAAGPAMQVVFVRDWAGKAVFAGAGLR
ncbi:hypothetical protein SPHINGOT1_130133 [Sphingomonas sp. T1]|nr:hypothetical protein SPHINGOT1_130133 [Sphingomonas sp. T1]